jgi:hypothetical protein
VRDHLHEAMQAGEAYLPALDANYQEIMTTLGALRSAKNSETRPAALALLHAQLAEGGETHALAAEKRSNALVGWMAHGPEVAPGDYAFLRIEAEVQEMIVKVHATQTLNADDSLFLLSIAESCPWLLGDAVYRARALYARLDADRSFDEDYCGPAAQSLEREEVQVIPTPLSLRIFPNPANDYVLIQADRPFAGDSPIRVTDALGREVVVSWLAGEEHVIMLETNGLSTGVYYVGVLTTDGQRAQGKFIKL